MAELREWLEARGLGRYADALLAQDIELDILSQLTDADLTAAGLPVGARKRLLQAIEGLRNLSDAAMQSPPIVPTTEPATERAFLRRCRLDPSRRDVRSGRSAKSAAIISEGMRRGGPAP